MKKYLAIILISVIAGDSIRIEELVKLPNLLLHYAENKSAHPEDTAMIFLFKHYISNQKPESDKDQTSDSGLPYKSPQNLQSHLTTFIFSDNTITFACGPIEKSFIPIQVASIPSCSFDIWQPPKVS